MVVFLQTHLFGIPLFKEYCYYSTFSFSEFSFSGYFCIKWVLLCMRCVAGFIIFQTNFSVINKLLPVVLGSKLLQNKSDGVELSNYENHNSTFCRPFIHLYVKNFLLTDQRTWLWVVTIKIKINKYFPFLSRVLILSKFLFNNVINASFGYISEGY